MLVMLIVVGAATSSGSLAAQKKADTIISLGESNDDAQRQELLGYFGAGDKAQVDVITVADTQQAMQDVIPGFNLSSAYSSAALTCRPLGDGLDVTTINITQITPAMFAMALVTAGVGDATLIVAAPAAAPAQGMTALTGIFKAWDKVKCESAQTTPKRQQLALRELAITVEISTAIGEAQTGYAGAFVIDTQRTHRHQQVHLARRDHLGSPADGSVLRLHGAGTEPDQADRSHGRPGQGEDRLEYLLRGLDDRLSNRTRSRCAAMASPSATPRHRPRPRRPRSKPPAPRPGLRLPGPKPK